MRLHLPTIQVWDCHACGQCCKEYRVYITAAEALTIRDQGWQQLPEYAGRQLVVDSRAGPHLGHLEDGSCVFLGDDGRCKIHAKFGGDAKPLACQIYPFVFHPTGEIWRVGLRYSCPSVVDQLGRDLNKQRGEIERYARGLLQREPSAEGKLPAWLRSSSGLGLEDALRISSRLQKLIADRTLPLGRRIRAAAAFTATCREAKLQGIRGQALDEFLELIAGSARAEALERNPQPQAGSALGRLLFRQTAALYARRDTGPIAESQPKA